MGKIIVDNVDCNQISKLNKPENWVFVDKNIAIPKEELKYLKKDQIIQPSSSPEGVFSEEKGVSNSSPSKENPTPFSPKEGNEEKVSYKAALLKKAYNLLPEPIQQMAVDAGANELIKLVKEADFKPGDEQVIIGKIHQFKDNSTRVSATEVGIHVSNNLEATHLRCRIDNEKGEEHVYECINPVRGCQMYNKVSNALRNS